MSAAPLGYINTNTPAWNGERGSVPLLGPVEEPCMDCGYPRRRHSPDPYSRGCRLFNPRPRDPEPHEIARCEVVTSWTCPHCDKDNEVFGEGAAGSWMECGYCFEYAWLSMDA